MELTYPNAYFCTHLVKKKKKKATMVNATKMFLNIAFFQIELTRNL